MQKTPKVLISCRIHPDLKDDLEREAILMESTTSNYLQSVLQNRHNNDAESSEYLLERIQNLEAELEAFQKDDQEKQTYLFSKIESLEEQIERLQEEKEELLEENQLFKNLSIENSGFEHENQQLRQRLEELSERLEHIENQFTFQLSDFEKSQVQSYLEELASFYPDAPASQLLIGSLHTTLKTEDSVFWVPSINTFLKQLKSIES